MLKWIALLLMTLDHIGHYLYAHMSPSLYYTLRILGRGAFPIFAFYIVKGFLRTSNPGKYIIRMASWAVLSHLTICAAQNFTGKTTSIFDFEWTNVMVLFTFGIIMLAGYDLAMRSYHDMVASMNLISDPPSKLKDTRFDVKVNLGGISMPPRFGVLLGILMIIIAFFFANVLHADYETYGLIVILLIYISYDKEENKVHTSNLLLSLAVLNLGYILMYAINKQSLTPSIVQSASILIVPFFNLVPDSKRRPSFVSKYFFYLYYPAHIALLLYLASIFVIK